MDRGEESSFISWRSLNDRFDDDGAYFELNLGLGLGPHHKIIINEEVDDDVPFPGFQPSTLTAANANANANANAKSSSSSSSSSHLHQNQQFHVVEINSRWGPWGLVHTTTTTTRKVESSVMNGNGRRSWTVKVINISAASLERWFANFMMAFRLRSWKEKMMKMKILQRNGNGNSIIITNSSRSAVPVNLGHQSSLLHAAIAHCNNSCFPPLTLTN